MVARQPKISESVVQTEAAIYTCPDLIVQGVVEYLV